jgi:D-alanyl-D-alanine carboxypeptidase (penicillin-binding protein 5/6)
MNAAARRLGMTATSYTDASGLDSATTSTAADQVRLGAAAMGVPTLAAITATPTAVVPVAGTIRNTNTLLGQDGIVGLKTGSTQAAGGCILIAARQGTTLIVAAVFGQPGSSAAILPNALQAGRSFVLALDGALGSGTQTSAQSSPQQAPDNAGRGRDRRLPPDRNTGA